MLLKDVLDHNSRQGKALLAVNFYNFETLTGILQAASSSNYPVILQLSEGSINYMGLEIAVKMAQAALKDHGVRGWLHLDHGGSLDLVKRCLDAGFDSVMIDASEKPFRENVDITKQAVKMAKQYYANVEAELGYVAKLGQTQQTGIYTQPEEAKLFVEETGVDALAIAIGSAHGFYKDAPHLQMELLSLIHAVTPAALVLHGSSGIPDIQLQEAIKRGITKINLATETKNAFMKTLQQTLSDSQEIDLRKVFPTAISSVKRLVSHKLNIIYEN